jgi:hypothetical protein
MKDKTVSSLAKQFVQVKLLLKVKGMQSSRYRYKITCSIDNMALDPYNKACGVPHSCPSHSENSNLYWKPNVFTNIRSFITGTSAVMGTTNLATTNARICVNIAGAIGLDAKMDKIGTQ